MSQSIKDKILLLQPGDKCEIANGLDGNVTIHLRSDGLYYAYEFSILKKKSILIDRYPLSKIDGLISYVETWYVN